MRADLRASRQHRIQVVTADDVAYHQHAGQHAQPAGAGHRQRHARTAPRIFAVVPVADQQKRKKTGQFPEKSQLDKVARQHDANHRPHEGQKEGKKARYRVARRHVVARIQHHQRANAQHQHAKHPGKAVQPDHQVQAQRRQPFNLLTQHAAIDNLRKVQRCLHGTKQRNQASQRGFGIARIGGQQCRQEAAKEGEGDKGNQGHARRILRAALGASRRTSNRMGIFRNTPAGAAELAGVYVRSALKELVLL